VLRETIESLQTANLELKKAQNDVIRAEKLATVGRLTSGIAHEIGNPIGIVLGYLDLLKQSDLSLEERNDFIDRSEKEIVRINHIIRQLLDMSRTSADEAKSISIHLLLQDLIAVFNYQPTADQIVFESRFEAGEDRVHADPDRLRQVFLNILLNAVDALNADLPSDPQILLATANLVSDEQVNSIEVIIQDNGPGIPSSHLSRVFDPFFTTKQPGKGTGLGLSVSFMIIEKLGGRLSASRLEDNGAAFRVVLPLARATLNKNTGTPAG
jgi:signal transduction histidine kinase